VSLLPSAEGLRREEEAPTFRKPVLVLRKVTERPEASQFGQAKIIGMTRDAIVQETDRLLTDTDAIRRCHMAETLMETDAPRSELSKQSPVGTRKRRLCWSKTRNSNCRPGHNHDGERPIWRQMRQQPESYSDGHTVGILRR
jgi:hypothetical protein